MTDSTLVIHGANHEETKPCPWHSVASTGTTCSQQNRTLFSSLHFYCLVPALNTCQFHACAHLARSLQSLSHTNSCNILKANYNYKQPFKKKSVSNYLKCLASWAEMKRSWSFSRHIYYIFLSTVSSVIVCLNFTWIHYIYVCLFV